MKQFDYEYDVYINDLAPHYKQPDKITLNLKPHQLAALYKGVNMEKNGVTKYNILNHCDYAAITNTFYNNRVLDSTFDGKFSVSTNLGIIGDIVGYGKTMIALSIIASNNELHLNNKNIRSYSNNRSYSYFTKTYTNVTIPEEHTMINSTFIIVPRGPVYIQWLETITKYTKLKYLAIDNLNFIKKHLPLYDGTNVREIHDFYNQYDIVIIKNTTLSLFFDYYNVNNNYNIVKNWKRIMIDEAHDIINKIPLLKYHFLWLISGTYQELCRKAINSHYSLLYLVKDFLTEENINLMLLKSTKDFVRNSFNIPIPIEKYYLCKLSTHLSAIRNFISPSVLEKINANDISGAIRELGGKNETEKDMVDLVCREIKRDISNKEREKEYVNELDINQETKSLKLKNIDNELNNLKDKLTNLKERISELSKKTCAICLDNINSPIILECTHVYCGKCLMNLINICKSSLCPECRHPINTDNVVAIVDEKNESENIIIEDDETKILSKEDTFIKIIKNKLDGKFLVFSRIDNGFSRIIKKMKDNNIKYAELKGTTVHMMNILNSFKKGDIKIILLNTQYAGSGIDINFATDVIIFHSMGLDKQQAVGRAQRVGRTDQLYIHNLCYDHEMES